MLNVIRGRRCKKAHRLLGTGLSGKPLRTMRDGDLLLASMAGTKARAEKTLYDLPEASAK